MNARALPVVILLLLSAFAVAASLFQVDAAPVTLFSDNFESYQATPTCNNVSDGCFAPPNTGSASSLPKYWVLASSATCRTRGGCTTWGKNDQMGPNSVAAVVTEQAASRTKSAKLGASDWYADKTSMAVWLSPNVFPSGQPITYSYEVWLSSGIDNPPAACNISGKGPNNVLNTLSPFGQIRYYGNHGGSKGDWEIEVPPGGQFTGLGSYYLTTQTWHMMAFTVDWTHGRWLSLVVDGQRAFDLSSYSTAGSMPASSSYVNFATFIVPYCDFQSITSAPSHGFSPLYAYVDNVAVTIGQSTGVVSGSQSSSTTSTQTTTTPSISTSTTTSVGVPTVSPSCPVAVVVAGSVLEPYANALRGFRNNQILKTSAGRAFMSTFNTWYYSWAPSVAWMAAENHLFADVLRVSLIPLLGILYASYYSYSAVAPLSPEAGAMIAGIVAASLIGLVYVAPCAYLSLRILRLRKYLSGFREGLAMRVAAWVVGNGVLIWMAYVLGSFTLMGIATAGLTIAMLTLGSIVGVRAVAAIQPSIIIPALSLDFKRFKQEQV